LYFIVHGVHRLAGKLLTLLGLSTEAASTGRFRDCYLQRAESDALEIHLLTRNGGGNRPEHVAITRALRAHPYFLRDYDEPVDRTFATYVFKAPIGALMSLESAVAADPSAIPKSFEVRSQMAADMLQNDPNNPEAQRIAEALRPTMEALANDPDHVKGLLDET
jgi:hypothetical protein